MQTNLFYNSKCLFVEYLDIIKAPMYTLINVLRKNEKAEELFDFSEIKDLDDKSLMEWYMNRKHFNLLKDIIRPEVKFREEDINQFLYDQLTSHKLIWDYSPNLCFTNALSFTLQQKLVEKVYVYMPFKYDYASEILRKDIKNDVNFVYGNIENILKNIPNDSTFVFSNIENINTLKKLNKLYLSSVIIPFDYRYDKKLDDIDKYKIDFNELTNEVIFKYGLFKAFQ